MVGVLAQPLVVLLPEAGGAYWPLATYSCPSLEPFPSFGGGGGLSSPCALLSLPGLSSPAYSPFLSLDSGAPGPSLFHCFVSSPHRGGQQPSPLATCVQADTPNCR